ncbi:VP80 [Urbanus proteus nucleopolyhedrovirus]|uniref:VP80 n=1 Tax=Urbanus proteus nucleopolyhedrovirus TaxID=1675866 RepID=A0A162GU16_9ABAC|nr:VP80 [Urbanus proteus nucleopolyhedrovirus]AKR17314.1 VP80 [Urbanus proteus nucleopolyhedrovirus]
MTTNYNNTLFELQKNYLEIKRNYAFMLYKDIYQSKNMPITNTFVEDITNADTDARIDNILNQLNVLQPKLSTIDETQTNKPNETQNIIKENTFNPLQITQQSFDPLVDAFAPLQQTSPSFEQSESVQQTNETVQQMDIENNLLTGYDLSNSLLSPAINVYSTTDDDENVIERSTLTRKKRKIKRHNNQTESKNRNVETDAYSGRVTKTTELSQNVNYNTQIDGGDVSPNTDAFNSYASKIQDELFHYTVPMFFNQINTLVEPFDQKLIDCPTESLRYPVSSTMFSAHNKDKIKSFNITNVSNKINLYYFLQPLTCYHSTAQDETISAWFIMQSSNYFLTSAKHFYDTLARFNNDYHLTIFAIVYNFLYHYKQFISKHIYSSVSPYSEYPNTKLLDILTSYSNSVLRAWSKIYVPRSSIVVTQNTMPLIQLINGTL